MRLFSRLFNGLCLALSLIGTYSAYAQDDTVKTLTSTFEVSINQRANPGDDPYSVIGILTMNVDQNGGFTGTITAAKDSMGNAYPSVLFRGKSRSIDLSGPASLNVSGQIVGRAISLAIQLPDNKYIFGSGVSRDDLTKMPAGDISGIIGGSAVTSDSGETGDWLVKIKIEQVPCPPNCVSISGSSCIVCVKITVEIAF